MDHSISGSNIRVHHSGGCPRAVLGHRDNLTHSGWHMMSNV